MTKNKNKKQTNHPINKQKAMKNINSNIKIKKN